MLACALKNCVITASDTVIVNTFADGMVRHLWLDGLRNNESYHEVARWAGYRDWYVYAVEHDIAHGLIADWRGMKWCPVLHDPFDGHIDDSPQEHKDIEHLANALQRWKQLNEPDPYGCLEAEFGDKLELLTIQYRIKCWDLWHTI